MSSKNKLKILIAEDDRTLCDGMATVLKKEGYRVIMARDGAAGSSLLQSEKPDLLITDLKLPEKTGMQLLQEAIHIDPELPVILISAFGTIDLAVSALKSGARDFIPKPFSVDELKNKVSLALKDIESAATDGESGESFHGLVGT